MFDVVVPVLTQQDEELSKELKNNVSIMESKFRRRDKSLALTPNEMWQLLNETRRLDGIVSRITRTNKMFRRQSVVLLVSCLDEHVAEILRISYPDFSGANLTRHPLLNLAK